MSQTIKWIIAVALALVTGAGAAGMAESWRSVRELAGQVRALQQEGDTLAQSLERTRAAARAMAEWNGVKDSVRKAGLEPREWSLFPVSLNQDLTADGLNQMIALASQGRPRGGTYWFLPQSFAFTRIPGAAAAQSGAPGAPGGPGGAGQPAASVTPGKAKLYHGQMQGMFMTRALGAKPSSTP